MKLALAQMLVLPGEREHNLARATHWIAEAARRGVDCVLLPEALNFGWTDPSARAEAREIPDGDCARRLRAAAREHRLFVCAGLIEQKGSLLFNSALLIDPQGAVLLHHRKIHELDFARELYACGDRLTVAETPLGRLGLMICADGFAPGQSLSRSLGLMGARLILSPCAWAVPAAHDPAREPYGSLWLENYGPVAREFQLTIAGCSNVGPILNGPWRGRNCIGNSLVVGPDGKECLRGPYGAEAETLLLHELSV